MKETIENKLPVDERSAILSPNARAEIANWYLLSKTGSDYLTRFGAKEILVKEILPKYCDRDTCEIALKLWEKETAVKPLGVS